MTVDVIKTNHASVDDLLSEYGGLRLGASYLLHHFEDAPRIAERLCYLVDEETMKFDFVQNLDPTCPSIVGVSWSTPAPRGLMTKERFMVTIDTFEVTFVEQVTRPDRGAVKLVIVDGHLLDKTETYQQIRRLRAVAEEGHFVLLITGQFKRIASVMRRAVVGQPDYLKPFSYQGHSKLGLHIEAEFDGVFVADQAFGNAMPAEIVLVKHRGYIGEFNHSQVSFS
jgi:hypothetical protein